MKAVHLKPHFDLALFMDFFLLLILQEGASKAYSVEILQPLCMIISLSKLTAEQNYAPTTIHIVLKLLESESRFEDLIVEKSQDLTFYVTILLAVAYIYRDDEPAHLSKRALGAVGNLSTRPNFSNVVSISNSDHFFNQVVDLLFGSFSLPKGVASPNSAVDGDKPLHYTLYTGIACVILGNMATSEESTQELLRQVPNVISTAMNYFTAENDPFGLQGAHLIKNITINLNAQYSAEVLQRGGAALVEKLLNMTSFSKLRLLGTQISKNLLSYTSHLGSMEAALDYGAMVASLSRAYYKEDNIEIINEIVLSCDTSIADLLLYEATDGDEEASEFLEAETLLSKLFINFLYSLYKTDAEINVVVTVKASKSLGVLSSAPALAFRQPDPSTIISILDHTVRNHSKYADKLTDILGEFSSQLVEAQPKGRRQSNEEAVAKTFKGIINNLGYVGSKLRESDNENLRKACEIAIHNAAGFYDTN